MAMRCGSRCGLAVMVTRRAGAARHAWDEPDRDWCGASDEGREVRLCRIDNPRNNAGGEFQVENPEECLRVRRGSRSRRLLDALANIRRLAHQCVPPRAIGAVRVDRRNPLLRRPFLYFLALVVAFNFQNQVNGRLGL